MNDKIKLAATTQPTNTTFYLCEKPSQARTLAKVLGAEEGSDKMHFANGVVIGHAYGHLLSLAMPEEYVGNGKWRLDNLPILPKNWVWKVNEKHRAHFENIGKYLQNANTVVIATDPDEEGELIGRQIIQAHGYKGGVYRLWASALNPASLENALQNLHHISATDHFYQAGYIRHQLDWLYGMNLTRAFSVIFNKTTHIGRVKTRLLNELVKREKEIECHVPSIYETASVTLGDVVLLWSPADGPIDQEVSLQSLAGIKEGICIHSTISEHEISPPPPYSLSTLLADAADMGIPLVEGYKAVQELYESGAISYPRTNSTKMPSTNNESFAAHHAIVNVVDCLPLGMTDESIKIFELILENITNQNKRYIRKSPSIFFDFEGETFIANSAWVTSDCAVEFYGQENSDAIINAKTPMFKVGDKVQANIKLEHFESSPPDHYTEASLLRLMNEKNIGTEATRVATINKLVDEKVIERAPKTDIHGSPIKQSSSIIRSTKSGRELINNLPSSVTGPAMEYQLKLALDEIRGGQPVDSFHLINAGSWITHMIHCND